MSKSLRRKFFLVGENSIGKTSLIYRIKEDVWDGERPWEPSIIDEYVINIDIDGTDTELELWETNALEEYTQVRAFHYPEMHIFLFCFCIGLRTTLRAVHERWLPEVNYFCPDIPKFLVGCKKDLRDPSGKGPRRCEENEDCITVEEGQKVAQMIEAVAYLECSAFTGEGVTELLRTAAREASQIYLTSKQKAKGECIVL